MRAGIRTAAAAAGEVAAAAAAVTAAAAAADMVEDMAVDMAVATGVVPSSAFSSEWRERVARGWLLWNTEGEREDVRACARHRERPERAG